MELIVTSLSNNVASMHQVLSLNDITITLKVEILNTAGTTPFPLPTVLSR